MTLETAPTASRPRRLRGWQKFLLVILLCVVSLVGYVVFQLNRGLSSRPGLKSFDPAKAVQLMPEKRAAYERELFSQLSLWDAFGRISPTLRNLVLFEQRWQDMADDGLELAHLTLHVISPTKWPSFELGELERRPVKRLEQLAEQGDTGAMCLLAGLVYRAQIVQDIARYEAARRKWLERGAELGHPECMRRLGGQLLLGRNGYPQDIHRGLNLEYAARRAGYAHDAETLVLHYTGLGYTNPAKLRNLYDGEFSTRDFSFAAYKDPSNIRRLYCWQQIDDRFTHNPVSRWRLWELQKEAHRTHRSDLAALHDELEDKQYSLQDCVNLGTGEPTP